MCDINNDRTRRKRTYLDGALSRHVVATLVGKTGEINTTEVGRWRGGVLSQAEEVRHYREFDMLWEEGATGTDVQ